MLQEVTKMAGKPAALYLLSVVTMWTAAMVHYLLNFSSSPIILAAKRQ